MYFLFFCLLIRYFQSTKNFHFLTLIIGAQRIGLQRWNPVGFRVSHIPGLIYEMVPNLKMKDKYIETNSMGIRAKDYKIDKPTNTYRILVLGDSVAYGVSLNQEEVFSAILEDKLNSDKDSIRYEVINAAVPGYNISQEYIAFVNKWKIYKPDLVLVGFCINDLGPADIQLEDRNGLIYGHLKRKLNPPDGVLFEDNMTPHEILSISMPNIFKIPFFIHRRLMLYSSIYTGIMVRTYGFLSRKNPYKYPPQAYLDIIQIHAGSIIKQLKIYCQDNRINLIFILFPPLCQYGSNDYLAEIKRILTLNSTIYVDLIQYYQSNVDNLYKLSLDLTQCQGNNIPVHLNALGHKVTAEALYDYFIKYLKGK